MSEFRVLVIPAEESAPVRLETVDGSHEAFCALVEDLNTDTVFLAEEPGMVKVPASGKQSDRFVSNPRATQTVERFLTGFALMDRVEGTAVFVGLDDEGDPADVSAEVLGFVERMFGSVVGS